MVDQRDAVLKAYPRPSYLLSTAGGAPVHITARISTEHSNHPAGALPGFTRAT
jgi:hypothetical protein